jgi:hypothetical protein
MDKIGSTAAVAVLTAEPVQYESVDSCSWQQILRMFEENVSNSRPSFFNHQAIQPENF